MPIERFQPGQSAMDGRGDRAAQQGPAAGVSDGPATRISQNAGAERWITMPGTPSSRTRMFDPWPSRRISTPSCVAAPHQGDQLVGCFRLGEILGRPAQLKPGVHGQRLALPHHVLKTGQKTHG